MADDHGRDSVSLSTANGWSVLDRRANERLLAYDQTLLPSAQQELRLPSMPSPTCAFAYATADDHSYSASTQVRLSPPSRHASIQWHPARLESSSSPVLSGVAGVPERFLPDLTKERLSIPGERLLVGCNKQQGSEHPQLLLPCNMRDTDVLNLRPLLQYIFTLRAKA